MRIIQVVSIFIISMFLLGCEKTDNNCKVEVEFNEPIIVNESTTKRISFKRLSSSSCSAEKEYIWEQLSGVKSSYHFEKDKFPINISFPKVQRDEIVKFRVTIKSNKKKFIEDIKIIIKNIIDDKDISPIPIPTPTPTVISIPTPTISSSEECIRFYSNNLTNSDVDISSDKVEAIANILEITDPNNGYQLFLRNNEDFMRWIDMNTSLSTAIHETNHGIDFSLDHQCTPKGKEKYFSLGNIYTTDLIWDETEHYSIVDESFPAILKTASRYDTYILGMKDANGNTFGVLLDELNAYVGDAYFQINFRKSELEKDTNHYNAYGIFQIDGVVNFMVYLEYYLKTARLNYPKTYEHINHQNTIDYIQYIWNKAEEVLIQSYPYLIEDSGSEYVFFTLHKNASGLAHLKTTYSDEALLELDSLGITHRDYDFWESTYFHLK